MLTSRDTATSPADPPVTTAGDGGTRRRFGTRRLISIGASVALIAAIFWFVLPQVADFSKVRAEIGAMTGLELGILVLVAGWNLVTYWMSMVATTPGLTYRQAMVATEASTAVANTVPGGSAIAVGLTYSMLGSWGFSRSRTTVSLVVAGIWNNFVKLGMPVIALALLAFQGQVTAGRVIAGAIGIGALVAAIGVFACILHSESFAERAGERAGRLLSGVRRLLGKGPATGWGQATLKFRNRVIGLVRHSWIRLSLISLVGHLSLFAVLLVTLRDIGVSNTEVGLIGGLTSAGGDHAQVVAAVLVYRMLTFVLPIGLGVVSYLFWKRNTSWLNSAPPLDPALVVAGTVG